LSPQQKLELAITEFLKQNGGKGKGAFRAIEAAQYGSALLLASRSRIPKANGDFTAAARILDATRKIVTSKARKFLPDFEKEAIGKTRAFRELEEAITSFLVTEGGKGGRARWQIGKIAYQSALSLAQGYIFETSRLLDVPHTTIAYNLGKYQLESLEITPGDAAIAAVARNRHASRVTKQLLPPAPG
jgi:hypothetical protein